MGRWLGGIRRTHGLAACALALAAAVCGTPSVSASGGPVFTMHLVSEPDSLDPAKTSRVQSDQVMWLLYDRLTQLSADGSRMEPALAERWEQSADGLTYTFSLRRNVVFHDGSPVDAQAVKISYERQYLSASPQYSATPPNAYERVLSGLVKDIRVLDSHTVAISLHYPQPQQFALVSIVSPQALAKSGGHLGRAPIGTGPFRLERWEGDRILLTAFPASWRGRPRVGGATFVIVPDSQAAVERLEAGDFHLLSSVAPQYFERLAANPDLRLVKVGGLNVRFLGMQMERPALRDRRVREAIVRAVDVERLVSHSGRGALLAARGPLPPASLGYDPQLRQPAYDPQQARNLLQDADATAGLSLRVLYNASLEYWSEAVHAIRSDLRKVGIQLEPVGVPDWKAFHETRRQNAHDMYLYGWSVSTPDPERFLFRLFHSKSPDNFGRYGSGAVDDLLEQARQPMDEARRLRLYREATRTILTDIPALFLFHHTGFAVHRARAAGLTLNLYGWPQDKLTAVEIR